MNSKQRVKAVFAGQIPDQVPRWCGASSEFWAAAKQSVAQHDGHPKPYSDEQLRVRLGDDFRRVSTRYNGPQRPLQPGATWQSPFGVQRHGIGYGQPLSHPLASATTVAEIECYPWPDPQFAEVSEVRREAAGWAEHYAILGGEWSPYWHDAIDLVGHENLYYLMYDYPAVAEALFTKISEYYIAVSRRTFELAADLIDIFFIGNDFGGQQGPLIGIEQFKQFLLPPLRGLIDLGHQFGLPVMLHCCGGYRELLPAMIDCGLDAVHALQPDARGMDPVGLKRDFGRQIVLNGAIDTHRVLIDGSTQLVRDETRRILDIMMPGGRYIAGASHDSILVETPVQNVLAMFETIDSYGGYA